MIRDEHERLRDIKDAIAAITSHLSAAEVQHASGATTDWLHDALLFQFVVIGEAVKNLDPGTRTAQPHIAWADIAGLRDLIAHEYFRIEMDRILAIVERDLPLLERAIDQLLDG